MVARRIAALLLIVPLLLANVWAKSKPPTPQSSQHLTKEERLEIIRGLSAELCFARVLFPMGKKGLVLKEGKVVSPRPKKCARCWRIGVPPSSPATARRLPT